MTRIVYAFSYSQNVNLLLDNLFNGHFIVVSDKRIATKWNYNPNRVNNYLYAVIRPTYVFFLSFFPFFLMKPASRFDPDDYFCDQRRRKYFLYTR